MADRLSIPYLELDSVYHQPNWTPLPDEAFHDAVRPLIDTDAWVVDGNYTRTGVQDLIWQRADTVVWLDLPRLTVMRRLTWRTVSRGILRQELWNGNRESIRNLISADPEVNIVMWTWTRYAITKDTYERRMTDARWRHLEWVRLGSQREIDRFAANLGT
jgi:adenylate kinase family enzyme